MTETNSTESIPRLNDIFLSEKTGNFYEVRTIISEGGFGTVFKACCTTK